MIVTQWGAWHLGRRYPVALGRGGISGSKREGDGATPAAALHLLALRWRADRSPRPVFPGPRAPIGPRDLWSDDPRDPAYNHPVRAPHPFGHERQRRPDPLYDVFVVTDWNFPTAVPGRGSAIFVHIARGPRRPTEGCLAFSRPHLLAILARWRPWNRILIRS